MTNIPSGKRISHERTPVPWPTNVVGADVIERLRNLPSSIVGSEPVALAEMADDALHPLHIPYDGGDFVEDANREAWNAVVAGKERLLRALLRLVKKDADGSEPVPSWLHNLDPTFAAARRVDRSENGARRLANIVEGLRETEEVRLPSGRGRPPVKDAYFVIARVAVYYRFTQELPYDAKWKTARETGAARGSRRSNDEHIPVSDTAVLVCELVDAFGLERDNVTLAGVLRRYLGELKRKRRDPRRGDSVVVVFTD